MLFYELSALFDQKADNTLFTTDLLQELITTQQRLFFGFNFQGD